MFKELSRKLVMIGHGYDVYEVVSQANFEAIAISDTNDVVVDMVDRLNEVSRDRVTTRSCYTPSGQYIGDETAAEYICVTKGIKPQALIGNKVCSIGFCIKEDAWYGWSHRAMASFRIGDVVSEGDVAAATLPVGYIARDLDAARRIAIAFANGVR
jgi:hypothetical protein